MRCSTRQGDSRGSRGGPASVGLSCLVHNSCDGEGAGSDNKQPPACNTLLSAMLTACPGALLGCLGNELAARNTDRFGESHTTAGASPLLFCPAHTCRSDCQAWRNMARLVAQAALLCICSGVSRSTVSLLLRRLRMSDSVCGSRQGGIGGSSRTTSQAATGVARQPRNNWANGKDCANCKSCT